MGFKPAADSLLLVANRKLWQSQVMLHEYSITWPERLFPERMLRRSGLPFLLDG